jgi:Fic family protein
MSIITTNDNKGEIKNEYQTPDLPFSYDIETKKILKKVGEARSALAELKGVATTIPNEGILMNTLPLQEAQDSSEIENIITTQDELYKSDIELNQFTSRAAKEVHNYALALTTSYKKIKQSGIFTNNCIKEIQEMLEENKAGFRSQAGTALKNDKTKEVIYTPPQTLDAIEKHMKNLELFINDDDLCDWDSLVKLAVIHHQFESIHPFFDGNGRTGRIIIILYLIQKGFLDSPILYLSRYINKNKGEYYRLLQAVRDNSSKDEIWQEWILYVLEGIRETSIQTTKLIKAIKKLMQNHKNKIRSELPKIYSQDLINIIFSHPYTKINHVKDGLRVERRTASKYLNELEKINLLTKVKIGKENYYINKDLMTCLSNVHDM